MNRNVTSTAKITTQQNFNNNNNNHATLMQTIDKLDGVSNIVQNLLQLTTYEVLQYLYFVYQYAK